MEALTVKELYTLDQTIAKDIFEGVTYPWEVLPKISSFIVELGNTLSSDEYEKRGENVWVARSAKVAPTAYINGPAIIGKDAEVRHCAFIRGNAIVGEGAVVGNSTELKNVILFNKVEVGCGSVLNPGTVVGSHSNIYPLSSVRGFVPGNSIYKKQGEVVEKRAD